jgi:hypothetical protein
VPGSPSWLNPPGEPDDTEHVNRKHLSLAALAVVLVALGIALLPFKAGSTDCSPAAISAWEKYSVPDFSRPQGGAGAFAALGEASPTKCAKQGRIRLEKSGVLLGLTAFGLVLGRRILQPEPLSTD